MRSEWTIKRLSEIADFNPRESLPKGTKAKKISMDMIQPYCRDIPSFEIAEFTGGTKFRNGDTIMARITPCLENGKTAQVNILNNNEIGFGSTEYIVFRAKEGISDPDYVYYLVCSPLIREPAIKSMVGSSGRQRVQTDVIQKLEVNVPSIEEQQKIASVLRTLDDKIKLNNEINKNLEQQAQTLFQEWFISNPASSAWSIGTFSDIIESMIAGDWGKESPQGNFTKQAFCIRGADIPEVKAGNKGKMPTRYILPKNYTTKHLVDGDVVIEISGGSPTQSTGRIAAISQSLLDRYDKGMICTNFCKALKPKHGYSMFLYYYWQYLYNRNVFFSYENGTTGIKNLDISGFIETEPIMLPPFELVSKFDAYCKSNFDSTFANGLESEQLSILRDLLLPKLMSGELDVSDLDL